MIVKTDDFAMQKFAELIDRELEGVKEADWSRVPDDESREHEKAIWEGVRK